MPNEETNTYNYFEHQITDNLRWIVYCGPLTDTTRFYRLMYSSDGVVTQLTHTLYTGSNWKIEACELVSNIEKFLETRQYALIFIYSVRDILTNDPYLKSIKGNRQPFYTF